MQHCFSGPPKWHWELGWGEIVNSGETPSDQGLCSLKGVKSSAASQGFPAVPLSPLPLAEVRVLVRLSAHTQAYIQD